MDGEVRAPDVAAEGCGDGLLAVIEELRHYLGGLDRGALAVVND